MEDQWLHFKKEKEKKKQKPTALCSLTFSSEEKRKTLKHNHLSGKRL